jgi:Histidine kinase-like ATPase domain
MTAHPLRHEVGLADGKAWRWLAPAIEMAAMASGNWPPSPRPGPSGWTCFPRVAIRTPGPDARAVREARGFTIATLQRWGVADRCDDIVLVVSELLANALRHALPGPGEPRLRCPVRLGLLQPGPCVLCAVADPSQHPPVLKEPGCLAETGRGLRVIGGLADAWGYTTQCDTGKVVWAVLSLEPAPAGMSPGPAGGQASTADGQALRAEISR